MLPSQQLPHFFSRWVGRTHTEEGNVRRLQGIEPPLYRLRTQDHRVIFRVLSADQIEVTRVRNRREAYR